MKITIQENIHTRTLEAMFRGFKITQVCLSYHDRCIGSAWVDKVVLEANGIGFYKSTLYDEAREVKRFYEALRIADFEVTSFAFKYTNSVIDRYCYEEAAITLRRLKKCTTGLTKKCP